MVALRLPSPLTGKTVLDVGGYDGKNALAALERGATSATVVDNGEWQKYDWAVPGHLPGVIYVDADVFDWTEPADLVICSNVIYHARDPFAMLAHLRTLTRERLILNTDFVDSGDADGWRWYPGGTGHPNGTVWCRPTLQGLIDAVHRAGFTEIWEQTREGEHVVIECA